MVRSRVRLNDVIDRGVIHFNRVCVVRCLVGVCRDRKYRTNYPPPPPRKHNLLVEGCQLALLYINYTVCDKNLLSISLS